MRCPKCGKDQDRVVDSRAGDDGGLVRRRRQCLHCHHRFTTIEQIVEMPMKVVKKDGVREAFQIGKIRAGIERACWKRPLKDELIQDTVAKIEREIHQQFYEEVETRAIGELVMAHLVELDQVAYVRFASVYRQFTDVQDFVGELAPMLRKRDKSKRPK
jgi:transcriptional repressor NrdR